MKFKSILLDFYGTLVEEDDHVVSRIANAIGAASCTPIDQKQIGRDWSDHIVSLFSEVYAEDFRTQRAIEVESIQAIVRKYGVDLDARSLAQELFAYWQAPTTLDDGSWFVANCRLPVCIVSNIDDRDLVAAISKIGWVFDAVVTSEGCRSYKPRPEMFLAALEKLKCSASEVLHIGDSLNTDVVGAQRLGISTAWVNRKNKPLPTAAQAPTFVVADLRELYSQVDLWSADSD